MTWKEFIYPTKNKVILSLIWIILIEILSFRIGLYSILCEVCTSATYCPPCISYETGFLFALIILIPATIFVYLIVSLSIYLLRKNK